MSRRDDGVGALRLLFVAAATAAVAATAGCGAATTMGFAAGDNNPAQLARALQRIGPAAAPAPVNATGKPLLFAVARAATPGRRMLIAYDLAGKRTLWRVRADVTSKVVVGGPFVAYRSGERSLVARDVRTGRRLWKVDVDGDAALGVAADRRHVYCVVRRRARGRHSGWRLVAVSAKDGSRRWFVDAPGQLGTAAAAGGLVFVPFFKQWLAIIDARTGAELTRIRGIDQEISFVRARGRQVFFGSRAGVFLLDRRAASGRRSQSTYGRARLPKSLSGLQYYWNGFDPVEAGYSAYDRHRVLWWAGREGKRLAFRGGRVVLHSDRFLFGIDAGSGKLLWAYDHPRGDVVASAELGPAVGFASSRGDIGALDPATGRRIYRAALHAELVGASFDAAGWDPKPTAGAAKATAGAAKPTGTEATLLAIARDRDARFGRVKRYAVRALAKLPTPKVTSDLLSIIESAATSPALSQAAADALVARRQASGAAALVAAVAVRQDYISGTQPRAVGAAARALASIARAGQLAPALRRQAITALTGALRAPGTALPDLAAVIRALGAVGGRTAVPPLESFLLTYRADPDFATDAEPLEACIAVLLERGGAGGRALVSYVAQDARTQQTIAQVAARALARAGHAHPQRGRRRPGDGSSHAAK